MMPKPGRKKSFKVFGDTHRPRFWPCIQGSNRAAVARFPARERSRHTTVQSGVSDSISIRSCLLLKMRHSYLNYCIEDQAKPEVTRFLLKLADFA
eukprot:6188218-Pleurochrysis_carterae.AAC.1